MVTPPTQNVVYLRNGDEGSLPSFSLPPPSPPPLLASTSSYFFLVEKFPELFVCLFVCCVYCASRRAMAACPEPTPSNEKATVATAIAQRADTLLEWLCLHLQEDELPKGFDPRGRMLDVIRPGQNFDAGGGGGVGGGIAAAPAADGNGIDHRSEGEISRLRNSGGGSGKREGNERGVGSREGGGVEVRALPLLGDCKSVTGERVSGKDDIRGGKEGLGGALESRLLRYGFGHAEVASAIATCATGGGGRSAAAAAKTEEEGSGVPNMVSEEQDDALDARMLRPLGILASGLIAAAPGGDNGGGEGSNGGGKGRVDVATVQSEEEGQEATEEEVMSLEAIYGDDVKVSANMPKVRRDERQGKGRECRKG